MPHPIPVETPVTTALCSPVIYPAPYPSDRRLDEVLFVFLHGVQSSLQSEFSLSPMAVLRGSQPTATQNLPPITPSAWTTLGLRAAFLIVSAIWLDRIVSPMFHPTEMICCDLEARVDHRTCVGSFASRMSAAFSAIAMTAAFVLPRTIDGITEASATRRPSVLKTRRSGSTTLPIAHVLVG